MAHYYESETAMPVLNCTVGIMYLEKHTVRKLRRPNVERYVKRSVKLCIFSLKLQQRPY